ncbi:hypothetical protein [Parerythrobacter jejuensis]|uniref:hypothetical protein n=1 Tax=Parerythrobacter jejuensis TaxID=795812 RepID=UPI0018F8C80B|nr:hypothetical protein [Parerythrobacter jejuensis]
MATTPEPRPDTIEPAAPPETPTTPAPVQPDPRPDEIEPPSPDIGDPGQHPDET